MKLDQRKIRVLSFFFTGKNKLFLDNQKLQWVFFSKKLSSLSNLPENKVKLFTWLCKTKQQIKISKQMIFKYINQVIDS